MTEEAKTEPNAATPIVAEAEKQEKILNALQAVLDPEIGLSVIDLDLIREVVFTPEEAEVRMVLTTPFCPYGPMLINQIQTAAETAAEMPVRVTRISLTGATAAVSWVGVEPALMTLGSRPAASSAAAPAARVLTSSAPADSAAPGW